MKYENIGIFLMSNSLSGAEKRFIRITKEFCEHTDNVILIINSKMVEAAQNDNEVRSIVDSINMKGCLEAINSDRIDNKIIRILMNFWGLIKIIQRRKVKVLHCSLGALKYTIIKKIIKIKIIAEITSPDVAKDLLMSSRYKNMVKYFDQIITVSDSVYDITIKSLKELNVSDLSQRVYCSKIPFFSPNKNANDYELYEKENLIVFASRFIDRKNPLLFANAVSEFLNIHSGWKVAVLGKGPLENEIKEILSTHISSGNVIVEHTKDMYGYLSRSKIFISLIWPDNYPSQSILEAMYMRNAIVATNVGNTYRLVTEENGFLVEEYKAECIIEVLNKAISDQKLLCDMGEVSHNKIVNEFSKEIYLRELNNIYNKLL